jgi:glycosyltransferase involved in cell wall biosynthesis
LQGIKYVCDRGSTHIRFQDRVLREEYDRRRIPFAGISPKIIRREEAEYEAADIITVPSTFVLNTFLEEGVSRKKIRLAPYGVDLEKFYPCAKRSEEEFHVLFVGGLSVRKGLSYLLSAFQKLRCEGKHLTLVGSVSTEIEKTIEPFRYDPQITFMGHRPQAELKAIMSRSHVMVLPSVEEGLACVQAQAMACGCPVIASRNTGAEDLFSDQKEGFIVPVCDADAIAARLQSLADDPCLQMRMSEAALKRVKSIGGWGQYGQRMFDIFSEAVTA